jgi:hypothetical protein
MIDRDDTTPFHDGTILDIKGTVDHAKYVLELLTATVKPTNALIFAITSALREHRLAMAGDARYDVSIAEKKLLLALSSF